MTKRHLSFSIPKKLGKTPDADWMVMLSVFACVAIAIIAFGGMRFWSARSFIEQAVAAPAENAPEQNVSKEEELRAMIETYDAKAARHRALLGTSRVQNLEEIAEQRRMSALASSTASTTGTTTEGR